MSRNRTFASSRKPLESARLRLDASRINGPVSFLNPTKAHYTFEKPSANDDDQVSGLQQSSSAGDDKPYAFVWRSRDNRKGRHALRVYTDPASKEDASVQLPAPTTASSQVFRGIVRCFTDLRPWDISWLVAQLFVWGSVVWVLNGFFVFMPFIDPSANFEGEVLYAGGITAFIGAIIFFETGSILLMLEAINANHEDCFGWSLEQLIDSEREETEPLLAVQPVVSCAHRFHSRRSAIEGAKGSGSNERTEADDQTSNNDFDSKGKQWQWFPSWYDLRTHYFHELGFLACLAQLFGATIFGISGFTALPGIQNRLSQPVLSGVYWVPQIVGGTGFIVSSILFMLETQPNWYTPALHILGWHIGFWNFVGAIGFTLSGSLGPAYGSSKAQYQAACSTFWGSWAFLIGSLLQLYESLQKHPVEKAKRSKM